MSTTLSIDYSEKFQSPKVHLLLSDLVISIQIFRISTTIQIVFGTVGVKSLVAIRNILIWVQLYLIPNLFTHM